MMEEQDFLRDIIDNLYDGLYYVDQNRRITVWNKSAERISGYSKAEVMGRCCSDNILRHIDSHGKSLCLEGCPLSASLGDGKAREAEIYLHHKDGYRVPVSVRISPVRDAAGKITGAVEIFSDNSKRIEILREMEGLKKEAYVDKLTGIGNRRFGEMALERCFHDLSTHRVPFGAIFFDIDHFKDFNDGLGHDAGDLVLQMTVNTALNLLRKMDSICRWGGDEFLIILPGVDPAGLGVIAERVCSFVEQSWVDYGGNALKVTLSAGATMAILNDDEKRLLKRADELLYQAKYGGRNRVAIG
jgi:diguanylate cyclase (GGDEF)-like protein/PAS domain S-box-containing protein